MIYIHNCPKFQEFTCIIGFLYFKNLIRENKNKNIINYAEKKETKELKKIHKFPLFNHFQQVGAITAFD